jgi:membrane-bound metal-dependent hydrolase YbcI (DUF457 family)
MPSPVGHALAGLATAYGADIVNRHRPLRLSSTRFVALCAGLAALPDADLLLPGTHRTFTHSFAAALITFIVAAGVTGKVNRWRTATVCAAAYATHLLLDWLGADFFPPRGIQLLWPWSDRWFISDLDVFRQTARQHFLTAPIIRQNVLAVAQEIAILAPIVGLLWLIRVKAAARFAAEMTGRNHPPQ